MANPLAAKPKSTGNAALDAAIAQISSLGSGPSSSTAAPTQPTTAGVSLSKAAGGLTVFFGSTLNNEREQTAPTFLGDEELERPKQTIVGVTTQKTSSLADAQLHWYSMSDSQQKAWAQKAYALGYITSPTNLQDAQQIWNSAIQESANYYSVGKKLTPWDVIDKNAGANASTLKQRAQGGTTQTNTSIDLSDRSSVEAISRQVLQQALGRDPTDSEVNTYFNTIRAQEKAHPSTTTTTTKTNQKTGNSSTSSVSSGGFTENDAADFLQSKIQDDPEYAKYQAGTTYFNAAMAAVGQIGGA